MNAIENARHEKHFWTSLASLFASSSTLICCALPSLLVALGAGATLSSLVSALPQLVWLSEHQSAVFGLAGSMLAIGGWLQWTNRSAPCPLDPILRRDCMRVTKISLQTYLASALLFLIGAWFALVQPLL